MQRNLLSTSLLAVTTLVSAQLAPTTDAPLYQHLLEVNKEWRTMFPSLPEGGQVVHFANEAERIATHLHLVREHLATAPLEGLATSSAIQRSLLLNKLEAYADRGRFPQNHVLATRNPIFIDPVGTACAVGQLMIESDHRALAQRIHDEINFAYVHDMKRDDVNEWATEHGFTEDELAWIQPGYPPVVPWAPLGEGTNGRVTELLRLSNGDLIVAGEFSLAGEVYANQVARWNGAEYEIMGGGVNGEVTTAMEFNGDIYLGGSFGGGVYDLVRWNGSSWEASAVFASKLAWVSDLHIHNGALYAAGASTGIAGTSYEVKMLSMGYWQNVGQQLNAPINALETFDGALVCGGDFTGEFFSQDTTLAHVARLNAGQWEQLGDGLNGAVKDLLVKDQQLHAGGMMIANIAPLFGLSRIAIEALNWEPLMPNITNYIGTWSSDVACINALYEANGEIYFGGFFSIFDMLTYGSHIGKFVGTDQVVVMAIMDEAVNDLDMIEGSQLVAAGDFQTNNGNPTPYIATTEIALGAPEDPTARMALRLWPNPVADGFRIDGIEGGPNVLAEVIDATGRVMSSSSLPVARSMDVSDLPPGAYRIRLTKNNTIRTAAFIKR